MERCLLLKVATSFGSYSLNFRGVPRQNLPTLKSLLMASVEAPILNKKPDFEPAVTPSQWSKVRLADVVHKAINWAPEKRLGLKSRKSAMEAVILLTSPPPKV